MAAIPESMHTTAAKIYAVYEKNADSGLRPHLGASLIGKPCERSLWLTFRWAERQSFEGRMLRLFETGQREEARIVANLRSIGVDVHDTDPAGEQWRVAALGGHFGGSIDAAAKGVPEAPKTWHVCEFKTANDKSWQDMAKHQVQKSKPEHYAQMQTYMGLTGMTRALYVMVNKNTDALHIERLEFDEGAFKAIMDRAERVISAVEPPLRISQDPSWYQCKMCSFRDQCHGEQVPLATCRSCAHVTPELDGEARWSCAKHGKDLDAAAQLAGCADHRYIPVLMGRIGELVAAENDNATYRKADGTSFTNGEGGYTSEEIRAAQDKSALGDKVVEVVRAKFGAKVIG